MHAIVSHAQPFALSTAQYALPDEFVLSVVSSTGSTNSDLLALAREGALPAAQTGKVAVRIAHAQHAGRGRMGRAWHAPAGASLLMSVACVRTEPLQQLGAVTLALGIAAADALHAQAVPVQLKWPNDVLLNGAKLAGILVESVNTREGLALVAGIGINGTLDPHARAACGQPVAALEDAIALDTTQAAAIGCGMARAFAQTLRASPAEIAQTLTRFVQFDALHGREITLLTDGTPASSGCALGIDSSGHLLVRSGNTVRRFASGEVSPRAA
jgi:BirA family transcriptional regulator, biotin operon repressor / biotin---[acetyl-CoA-carboxylase] ligase